MFVAHYVLGISGASGIVLGFRTLHALTAYGHEVDLVITRDAFVTASLEMGTDYATYEKFISHLSAEQQSLVHPYKIHDFMAPIASGSAPREGMIITPCSMATLAAIAIGLSDNLLRRAADVAMKERRPLVIVPRETPFHATHLQNMLTITQNGGIIVPPIPAWYTNPKSLEDVEKFIVGKILDVLKISTDLYPRWGDKLF